MSDRLRSFRNTWKRVGELARGGGAIGRLRESLRDLRKGEVAIRSDALTRAIAHAPGVESASVACEEGVVRVHASYTGKEPFAIGLAPRGVHFAPRGAKEVRFLVSPSPLAADVRAADIVGALASAIAHNLWGALLRSTAEELSPAIAELDGDCLRVDLRTAPAVRTYMRKAAAAVALEILELEDLRVETGRLVLRLRLLKHMSR